MNATPAYQAIIAESTDEDALNARLLRALLSAHSTISSGSAADSRHSESSASASRAEAKRSSRTAELSCEKKENISAAMYRQTFGYMFGDDPATS